MDKIEQLYNLYVSKGLITDKTSIDVFRGAKEDQVTKLYDLGKSEGLFETTDVETFSSAWATPKKATAVSTESPLDSAQEPSSSGTLEEKETPTVESESSSVKTEEEPNEDIAGLYDRYKAEGKITPAQTKTIRTKIQSQQEGDTDRSVWEDIGAYANGLMATGHAIPMYNYDTEKDLTEKRIQKNKVDFLSELPAEKVAELNEYAVNRTVELNRQDTNILAENSILEEKSRLIVKNLVHQRETIEQILDSGKSVPAEGIEGYEKLYEELVSIGLKYNENVDIIESDQDDVGEFYEELDLLKKNFGGLDYYKDVTRLATADMIAGLMEFGISTAEMASPTGVPIPNVEGHAFVKEFREETASQRDMLRPQLAVGDIENASDFGKWLFEQTATQVPIITVLAASGGTAGLSLLGASAGGQKMGELRDEQDTKFDVYNQKIDTIKNGDHSQAEKDLAISLIETPTIDYSPMEIYLAGTAFGMAEALSERVSLGILSKGKRALTAINRSGLTKDVKKGVGIYAKETLFAGASEGASEVGNQWAQNLVDILYLDKKDVHIFDGTEDALASGFAMGTGMRLVPTLVGLGGKAFMDKTVRRRIVANTNKIEGYLTELKNNPDISDEAKAFLQKKVDQTTKETQGDILEVLSKLPEIGEKGIKKLIKLDKKANGILELVKEVEKTDLSDEVKNELKQDYVKQVEKIIEDKEAILNPKEEDGTEPTIPKEPKADTKPKEKSVPKTKEEGTDKGTKGSNKVQGKDGDKSSVVDDGAGVQSDSVGDKGNAQLIEEAKANLKVIDKERDDLEKSVPNIYTAKSKLTDKQVKDFEKKEADVKKRQVDALNALNKAEREAEVTVKDVKDLDLSDKGNIDKAIDFLDKFDSKLTDMGKETLGMNAPIVVLQGAVKAMKLALKTAKTGAELIKAGIDYIKSTDWYKKQTPAEKKQTNKDIIQQINNVVNPPKKEGREGIEEELDKQLASGKTPLEAVSQFETKKERMIAEDILRRRETNIDPKKASEKALEQYNNSIASLYEKPNLPEKIKKKFIGMMSLIFDRQYQPKHLFKSTFGKVIRDYMISEKGTPGYAKFLYDEYSKDIYGWLKEADISVLNTIIGLRRVIAIDKRGEAKGKDPHIHPFFGNRLEAEAALEGLKEKLGEKKYNDLLERSDRYFKAFQEILISFKESGLINEESLNEFFGVNYQPRLYLKFLNDSDSEMSILEQGAQSKSTRDRKEVIKAFEGGSADKIIMDSKYLLSRSINIAVKVNEANTLANRIDRYLDEMSKKLKDLKKKGNKKDLKTIKKLEVLFKNIKKNPIVKSGADTKSGKPKYKYKASQEGLVALVYKKNGVPHQFLMKQDFYNQYTDSNQFFFRGAEANRIREQVSRYTGSGLLKSMATGINPAFFLTNTPRDFMFALTFSDAYSSFMPIGIAQLNIDLVKAIKDIETQSESYAKFAANGGLQDFLYAQGRFKNATGVKGILSKKELYGNRAEKVKEKIFNIVTLNELQKLSEVGIRLALFNRKVKNHFKENKVNNEKEYVEKLEKEGASAEDIKWKLKDLYKTAVSASRSTTDFSQGGLATKDAEAVVPYLNASVQGTRAAVLAIEERPVDTTIRMVQAGLILSTVPIAISVMMFTGDDEDGKLGWTEEFKKMSPIERYKWSRDGLSLYETINYQSFFTGKLEKAKDGTMQPSYFRITKPQFMTPTVSYVENTMLNKMYKDQGLSGIPRKDVINSVRFALENNISPIQGGVTENLSRNPLFKASLTYTTGYDFYREKDLSYLKGKVEVQTEGHENTQIETFYKEFGKTYNMSPARTKAAVESMITTKSTSPYVGGAYAKIENSFSDEAGKKSLPKIFLESFANRVYKTSSDWNRKILLDKEFSNEKAEVEIKLIEEGILIKGLAKEYRYGEIPKKEVSEKANKEFARIAKDDPYTLKRLLKTYTDVISKPKVDVTILQLKHETADVRAIFLMGIFGNDLLETGVERSEEDKKIRAQLFTEGIMNEETIFKYQKRIKEKGGN